MKKKLLIGGILILVVIAVFLINRFSNKHEEGALVLSGNVEVTDINLGFKTPGRIVELLVEEGQKVNKDKRLALLDNAELKSIAEQNKAFLNETSAKLEELKAGSRSQEIEQAKASVANAEAELIKAENDRERYNALYKDELISVQQMENAKKTYDVALSQHKKAVEMLSLVKEGPRKEDIKAAASRVEQARAALKATEERLKDTVLYAPISGVVLKKNVELGETVNSGVPVYTIGDIANPWIKIYVKEDRLGLIKLGQKAEVKVDTYPKKVYEGMVTFISSEAEFTPKNVQTQEERVKLVFGIKVSVKNINDELKPGMPADVRIMLE
ncbi:MAG: efflux RND transporter periplasmic adaptor subunit [Nitrospirae bacterium]|nr:efflux RND transporter periplasmic adaptor subunit [Nitrospirota bacterium]